MTPGLVLFACVLAGGYAGFFCSFNWLLGLFLTGILGLLALFLSSKIVKALLILSCGFLLAASLAQKKLVDFKIREARIPSEFGYIEGIVEESAPSLLDGKKLQLRADPGFRLKVSLRDGAALMPVKQGDRIRIQGKIKHLQHAMAPGEFDSYWFGVARHFEGRISVSSPFKIRILQTQVETNYWAQLRQHLREHWTHLGTPREASVLLALTIGDTAFFEQEQKEIYQLVGAGHLLAVSGLQVSCLSFLFFYFFRFILLLIPWFGRLSRARVPAVILTLLSIWAFVILSGSSASAVRSAFMSSVILLGLLLNKPVAMIDSFGIAGFITVIVTPEAILDPSFTLSYLAIFGILIGGSLGAGIMTLPLSAYYFGMLALGGLLANLVLVPIAVFLQTPAIFLSVIGFVHEAAYLAGMIEALCEALGDYIGGYWRLAPPSGIQTAGYILALSLFFRPKTI
ncbi:MAG: ComEC/Rec2 family competence protein [Myxococcaceae bacterium]